MLKLLKNKYNAFLLKKDEQKLQKLIVKGLKIGQGVNIMGNCYLDPPHCFLISIGDDTTIAPHVRFIAHDASSKKKIGYTKIGLIKIGNDCFIGDSTLILPGVTIGDNTIIGAGSVVSRNIPPGSIAAGNPCKILGQIDQHNEKNILRLKDRKAPYGEFGHGALTDLQKEEVITFLKNGPGYIR